MYVGPNSKSVAASTAGFTYIGLHYVHNFYLQSYQRNQISAKGLQKKSTRASKKVTVFQQQWMFEICKTEPDQEKLNQLRSKVKKVSKQN